jgi:glycosyltransferase involved in cell wall biosynthesis
MRLALITDAWEPQTNGVVNTLKNTCLALEAAGMEILRVTPADLPTVPCPSYPEIRLALFQGARVNRLLQDFAPDALHIATEGPLGVAARNWALRRKFRFTTSYHTQFPEYVRARWPIPLAAGYAYMRWFHDAAAATMVSTSAMRDALAARGFRNLRAWGRGVDTNLFHPRPRPADTGRNPQLLYLGRVSVEKNVERFLSLDVPGTKHVVGDGPLRIDLQRRYPDVVFHGMLLGEALAAQLALADVLVFPSRTDTFGLVMLEAMACGVPVAAYPVTGPIDVVQHGVTGWLDNDLQRAVLQALKIDRMVCRRHALTLSWAAAAADFRASLVPAVERPLATSHQETKRANSTVSVPI